jgi:hypothetical protein
VNGAYVDAVPDTGADVSVMSLSFAKEHGFVVDTDTEHRISLQFADGSTATTIGMVRGMDWSFGSSEVQHHIDVYVLEELQTDLILDNTFLYDTNAFVAHESDFWTTNGRTLGDGWIISIIKLVDRVLKGSRWSNSSKYPMKCTCRVLRPELTSMSSDFTNESDSNFRRSMEARKVKAFERVQRGEKACPEYD